MGPSIRQVIGSPVGPFSMAAHHAANQAVARAADLPADGAAAGPAGAYCRLLRRPAAGLVSMIRCDSK
jgi:hypothetical protein